MVEGARAGCAMVAICIKDKFVSSLIVQIPGPGSLPMSARAESIVK